MKAIVKKMLQKLIIFLLSINQTRPLRIVLIRHGESLRNVAKNGKTYFADEEARQVVAGIPDHEIPLSDLGREQARRIGEFLKERCGKPDYIYHSGYARTEQTTDGILEAYNMVERASIKVRRNLFIRERDAGFTYDMTEAEAFATFPYLEKYWKICGGFFATPPGGESIAKVVERVHTFLDTIFRDRCGKNVFVVTHGGTIKAFRFLLDHLTYPEMKQAGGSPNCSVTIYEYDPRLERLTLRERNFTPW